MENELEAFIIGASSRGNPNSLRRASLIGSSNFIPRQNKYHQTADHHKPVPKNSRRVGTSALASQQSTTWLKPTAITPEMVPH
jgi:hypothetical protein